MKIRTTRQTQAKYKVTMYDDKQLMPIIHWHVSKERARAEALSYIMSEYERADDGRYVDGGFGILLSELKRDGTQYGEAYDIVHNGGKKVGIGVSVENVLGADEEGGW